MAQYAKGERVVRVSSPDHVYTVQSGPNSEGEYCLQNASGGYAYAQGEDLVRKFAKGDSVRVVTTPTWGSVGVNVTHEAVVGDVCTVIAGPDNDGDYHLRMRATNNNVCWISANCLMLISPKLPVEKPSETEAQANAQRAALPRLNATVLMQMVGHQLVCLTPECVAATRRVYGKGKGYTRVTANEPLSIESVVDRRSVAKDGADYLVCVKSAKTRRIADIFIKEDGTWFKDPDVPALDIYRESQVDAAPENYGRSLGLTELKTLPANTAVVIDPARNAENTTTCFDKSHVGKKVYFKYVDDNRIYVDLGTVGSSDWGRIGDTPLVYLYKETEEKGEAMHIKSRTGELQITKNIKLGLPLSLNDLRRLAGTSTRIYIDGEANTEIHALFETHFTEKAVYVHSVDDAVRVHVCNHVGGTSTDFGRLLSSTHKDDLCVANGRYVFYEVESLIESTETDTQEKHMGTKEKGTFATAFAEMKDINMEAATQAGRIALTCALTDEVLMKAFDRSFGKAVPKSVSNWLSHNVWGRTLNIYVLRPVAPLAVLNGISLASKVFGKTLPHSETVSLYARDALHGKWRDALQPVFSQTAKMFIEIAGELRGRALPEKTDGIATVDESAK